MMNALIVEDETAATVNLISILSDIAPDFQVLGTIESVTDTLRWLGENPPPDVIFMDIHLADGEAFRIFECMDVPSPIIFTTAYDRYALEAFKVNSIDYLLKPIREEELRRAIDKLRHLTQSDRVQYANRISDLISSRNQSTFLVHVRDKIVPVHNDRIAFCYTFNEQVTIHTHEGVAYPFEKSLETILARLPSRDFFRANRQFIIARSAISDISIWFGSRLCVNLKIPIPEHIIISKARVPEFKRWIAS